MDDQTLTQIAGVIAKKLNEGRTEEEAMQVLKSANYSDANIEEILGAAKVLRRHQPSSAGLEAAFGPSPSSVSQNVYVQQPVAQTAKKSRKGLVISAIIAVLIAVILLVFFILTQGNGPVTGANLGTLPLVNNTTQGNNTQGPVNPPEELVAPAKKTDEFGNLISEGSLETEKAKVEISKIILNDDKTIIDEVELAFSRKSESSSDGFYVNFEIWKKDSRESGFVWEKDGYPATYFALSGGDAARVLVRYKLSSGDASVQDLDKRTGCTAYRGISTTSYKVPYDKNCCQYRNPTLAYCEGKNLWCASYWYPCDLSTGEYELRVVVTLYNDWGIGSSSTTKEAILGSITKSFKLGPDAPKNQ